jgi:hypothetical protein
MTSESKTETKLISLDSLAEIFAEKNGLKLNERVGCSFPRRCGITSGLILEFEKGQAFLSSYEERPNNSFSTPYGKGSPRYIWGNRVYLIGGNIEGQSISLAAEVRSSSPMLERKTELNSGGASKKVGFHELVLSNRIKDLEALKDLEELRKGESSNSSTFTSAQMVFSPGDTIEEVTRYDNSPLWFLKEGVSS